MTPAQSGAGKNLRQLMARAGLTIRALADRAKYTHGSGVQRHLETTAPYLNMQVAMRLADAMVGLGNPPLTHAEIVRQLTGRDVETSTTLVPGPRTATQISVIGVVEAGAWRPAVEPPAGTSRVPWVAPSAYRGYTVVAFELAGHSMDKVYPHGSIILAVAYSDLGRDPRPGERVIVQRYAHDEVEASCKDFRVGPQGHLELWPLSTRPEHQKPLPYPAKDGETVHITHRVIGAIVHEPL